MLWRVENTRPASHLNGDMTAVAWILRQNGVSDAPTAMLAWARVQCNLSMGTQLLALILGTQLGPGVEVRDVHDDAFGAQAPPATVFHTVAAKVRAHE